MSNKRRPPVVEVTVTRVRLDDPDEAAAALVRWKRSMAILLRQQARLEAREAGGAAPAEILNGGGRASSIHSA